MKKIPSRVIYTGLNHVRISFRLIERRLGKVNLRVTVRKRHRLSGPAGQPSREEREPLQWRICTSLFPRPGLTTVMMGRAGKRENNYNGLRTDEPGCQSATARWVTVASTGLDNSPDGRPAAAVAQVPARL